MSAEDPVGVPEGTPVITSEMIQAAIDAILAHEVTYAEIVAQAQKQNIPAAVVDHVMLPQLLERGWTREHGAPPPQEQGASEPAPQPTPAPRQAPPRQAPPRQAPPRQAAPTQTRGNGPAPRRIVPVTPLQPEPASNVEIQLDDYLNGVPAAFQEFLAQHGLAGHGLGFRITVFDVEPPDLRTSVEIVRLVSAKRYRAQGELVVVSEMHSTNDGSTYDAAIGAIEDAATTNFTART